MHSLSQSIIIRADASARIGTGHLMRCMALAQSWRTRGVEVTFVTCCESDALRVRLSEEGMQVVALERPYSHQSDWATTSRVLRNSSTAWVVLDGYHFNPEYQKQVIRCGHRLLVIDDMAHLSRYYANFVLNQNIGADRLKYSHESSTRMLLGPQFALLRSEYLTWRGWKRKIPNVAAKVLVTLGGSDPHNATLQVIEALKRVDCPDLEVKIVAGASNPNIAVLKDAVHSAACTMSILSNVSNMAELMAWADVAVTAAGSTCLEMSFMKLPFAAIVLAENQRRISEKVEKAGIAINCGWYYELDSKSLGKRLSQLIHDGNCRSRMSEKAGDLVDGFGAERIIDVLEGAP